MYRCPKCGHEERQPATAVEVWHKCSHQQGHELVRLRPVER